jgi:hypothetical protein
MALVWHTHRCDYRQCSVLPGTIYSSLPSLYCADTERPHSLALCAQNVNYLKRQGKGNRLSSVRTLFVRMNEKGERVLNKRNPLFDHFHWRRLILDGRQHCTSLCGERC